MYYFFGLDLSLATSGICLIDNETNIVNCEVFRTNSSDPIEKRILEINDYICDLISNYYDDLKSIYLEGISFGSTGRSFSEICGVHYYIRCSISKIYGLDNNILTLIQPTTLKKFVTGKGQCKKELMLLYVYKNYGVEFNDNNLADAYSLARMAKEKYYG